MGGNGSDFVSQAGEILPDAGVHDAIKVRLPDNDTSEFLEGPLGRVPGSFCRSDIRNFNRLLKTSSR